jgi:hypothetical protein
MKSLAGAMSPGMIQGGAKATSVPSSNTTGILPPEVVEATPVGSWGALPPGTYYYVVTAYNATGETLASIEVSAAISAFSQDIEIFWSGVFPGTTGFRVYRGTSAGSEDVLIADVPANRSNVRDSGNTNAGTSPPGTNTAGIAVPSPTLASSGQGNLAAGAYFYQVTAYNGSGETTASAEQSITLAGGVAGSATELSWAAVSGATGYRVYRSTSSGDQVQVADIADGSATGFYDAGNSTTSASPPESNTSGLSAPVQDDTTPSSSGGSLATATYYYEITATNATGETTASNEKTAAVTGPNGSVALSWSEVSGATGYKVYRGQSSGHESILVATINGGATTDFVDTTAAPAAAQGGFKFRLWPATNGNTLAVATFLHLGAPVEVSVSDSAGSPCQQLGAYAHSTPLAGVPAIAISLWDVSSANGDVELTLFTTAPAVYVLFDREGRGTVVTAGGGEIPSLTAELTLFAFYGETVYTPGAGFADLANGAAVAPGEAATSRRLAMHLDQGIGANTPTFETAPEYWAGIGMR